MKKLMTALAILAVASVAQAELLATWNFASGTSTLAANNSAANAEKVTFGNFTRIGVTATTTTAAEFGANNWQLPGSIYFTADVSSGFQIANATIGLTAFGSGTGPATLEWKLNSVAVGTQFTASSTSATTGGKLIYNSVVGTIGAGLNTLGLEIVGTLAQTGGAVAAGGTFRMLNSMTFSGDIQSTGPIPEPATLSLLGLGALAMVIRRKMKK